MFEYNCAADASIIETYHKIVHVAYNRYEKFIRNKFWKYNSPFRTVLAPTSRLSILNVSACRKSRQAMPSLQKLGISHYFFFAYNLNVD